MSWFRNILLAACVVGVGACPEPPESVLEMPSGLLLETLPTAQRSLLRVTLEVSGSSLAETAVNLSADARTLRGTFPLTNVDNGPRTATLRVYGRFAEESAEVLLGRATDELTLEEGAVNGLDFADAVFEACDIGVDGACSLEFDRNRNGATNMLDLAPATVEGARGIDPAEQPSFVNASPETLQFSSGVRLGSFARQVIVIENTGDNPITFDALEIGGGQGVALSLFDPFGGPVARPRRSIPVEELNTVVEPGNEFFLAVSFAPVNAFLTTAGVQILSRDLVTGVVQATRVKIIANADGTLRPRPDSYVLPEIGASLDIGGGTIPVAAFPATELFSGQKLTTTGLAYGGATLTVTDPDDASIFTMPADRGFIVDIAADTRLAVSLTDLESDIDVAVVKLDGQNAVERVLRNSRHPANGSEGTDVLNGGDDTIRVAVILGRVELEALQPIVGGLALDTPAPFQLVCELSRGPEFSDEAAITPGAGPLEGGTPFTLRGRGFQPGAVVTFSDFRALDVVITVDAVTDETVITGLMPPGSLEIGKNPATAVVSNPGIEQGGDGQAATLPEAFIYDPPAAQINIILPDVCPTTGCDQPVTILGNFFTTSEGPPRVNFGDVAFDVDFVDAQTLKALPPPVAESDTVVVTVQNQITPGVYGAPSNGVAFRFTVPTGPRPALTSIEPATGPADGGDTLSMRGTGLVAGARVLFGSIEASVLTVEDDAISITSPPSNFDGSVDVTVVNPDGQSTRLDDAFTYFFPQPRIDAFLPQRVPSTGGTLLVVTGASFQAGLTAHFSAGSQNITPLSTTRTSNSSLLVTTPPLPVGPVTLVVVNPDGQTAVSSAIDVFEPQGVPPSIVFIEPASGPLQGRNLITIAGRNFDPEGVKIFLAGASIEVSVDVAAAAGLDRVQFEAPPSLTTGSQPLVVENGDGQSAVGSYLYVEIDVARIDQVLPSRLHFLPGADIQLVGEFFSTFSSEMQVFLGAGQDLKLLQLQARSDGLIVARALDEIRSRGLTAVSIVDGNVTVSGVTNVVVPVITQADERGDEIEVVGNDLAGQRLTALCAGSDGYAPTVAGDDLLLVRRDLARDARCPAGTVSPRPITLVYDNGARSFAPGAVVRDQTDLDGDGIGSRDDPDDAEPCVPNIIAGVCDFDKDGVINANDAAGQDPCVPSTTAATCTRDTDGDGVLDPVDAQLADACVPNSNALTCTQDSDADGITNPFDPQDGDPCAPNPGSTACTVDSDSDGVTDPFDAVDNNPCIPSALALNCDADSDGVFPPADTDNQDPCVPDNQDVLCTDDDDRDGVRNAADIDDANPCIPNSESLACGADADGDGVTNPFDAADADPCSPNPASATCTLDTDNDGVTDAFDPVDDNACVPNLTATVCDADGDGVFPPADSANQDPCVPNANNALCTNDDDRDGVLNPADSNDADACIPNSEALTCTADADGDGVVNPFDPQDADPCSPNPAAAVCSSDLDGDGVTDSFDPVDDDGCIPNLTATVCDADGDGVFPPADAANQDPCSPNANNALCTNDDDRDGVLNPADGNDADACIPNSNALTCTADADNDGVVNPFDPQDADPCSPNPSSPACSADADNDGVTDAFDPQDTNPCIPNLTATTCDADADGSFPPTDVANDDACIPNANSAQCTDDSDNDGVLNPADSDDANACIPNDNALTCTADNDADGVANPFDPSDGDPCAPNPASGACSLDSDADGVTDAFDPVDNNACIPSIVAINCDADGDTVLPPTDTANDDPCTPNANNVLCTDDDDRDGTANPVDADDGNACVPNSNALTCTADDDGDGVINPFDPDDADPCSPNAASTACTADADADGVTDPFDPVDTNACVPSLVATNCDADGDGTFPPADVANQDPCVPNANNALCSNDDDRDGVLNPADSDDANACIPNSEALTCTADADGDGVINPFDPLDADPCSPNPAATACSADADGDGVTDPFDPVDTNACVPSLVATNCDADGDGTFPPGDTANQDPCVPNANNALCTNDDDRDGTLNPADADDANACIPNSEALTCTADGDGDGVINPFDPADADPCAPNPAATACSADADGDGVTDPFDPADTDTCVPNITAANCDADGDGVLPGQGNCNPAAPVNVEVFNGLFGQTFVPGSLGVLDTEVPVATRTAQNFILGQGGDAFAIRFTTTFAAPESGLWTFSGDADDFFEVRIDGTLVAARFSPGSIVLTAGNHAMDVRFAEHGGGEFITVNAAGPTISLFPIPNNVLVCVVGDVANQDPCIPDANNALCTQDADGDGVLNPADAADNDACVPNSNALTCTADDDGDGVANPFDPIDNNSCVPNLVATNCDADADGVFPPTDTANQDPCTPDGNNALCTQDADGDGVLNPADPDDVNTCVPNTNALNCTADDDGDGLANPFDSNDTDACVPNTGSPACVPALLQSCLELRLAGQTTDGTYIIDPDGTGPIGSQTVFCDMTTDGGGYTFLKVNTGGTQDDAAEAFCATRGMQLLIPRTQAHLQRAVQIARSGAIGPDGSDAYMTMLGVYPITNGASCVTRPLRRGQENCGYRANDDGPFFIHARSDFGEPSGDNCTTCSINYSFDGAGNVAGFNDQGHVSSTRFICDVGDKVPGLAVSSFGATGCLAVEHVSVTGDDHGGIAVSASSVYYNGDTALGRFDLTNLSTQGSSAVQEGIVSDLESQAPLLLFSAALGRPMAINEGNGFQITHLASTDINGQFSGAIRTTLSQPITLGPQHGYFSGLGAIGIMTDIGAGQQQWFVINVHSGRVTNLGITTSVPERSACDSPASRGILEERARGEFAFLYSTTTRIVRLEMPSRRMTVATQFSNLSDMCSFAAVPSLDRWYFHHEGGSQFNSADETIGFCDADYCGDSVCGPGENNTVCALDCAATCGNAVCELGAETSASCASDCVATCGNGLCDETAAGCPADCTGAIGSCGDGFCQQNEAQNCPADCP